MLRLLSPSQHPHDVARHAARRASQRARSPEFRVTVLRAISPYLSREARVTDGSDWPRALHAWARTVRHVREPGVLGELLLVPERVVEFAAGDCDDVAYAVAAMAAHVGLRSAVLTIWTGETTAHAVAVVSARWYGPGAEAVSWVIDPEQPDVVSVLAPPYWGGRMFAVDLAG